MSFNFDEGREKDLVKQRGTKSAALAQSASSRGDCGCSSGQRRINLHGHSSGDGCGCSFEQRKVLDDSCEGAALQQILGSIRLQKVINPVVAVLDDDVSKHLRDRFEALLGQLAGLGRRASMCRASG
jgi:hypothetical protein